MFWMILPVSWRRKWQFTPVFLPGQFYGQVGHSPWGHKESGMTKRTHTKINKGQLDSAIRGGPWSKDVSQFGGNLPRMLEE